MNSFIFVVTGLSKTDGVDAGYSFKGKWYPTIVLSVVGLGLLYYFGVLAAYTLRPFYKKSLMQFGNVTCRIWKVPSFDMKDERARRFGHRRNISVDVSSSLSSSSCRALSWINSLQLVDIIPHWSAALFWLFGGNLAHSPLNSLEDQWNNMNRAIRTRAAAIGGGLTLKKKPSNTDSGAGEISRAVSRQESQAELHEMNELPEEGALNHGGMPYGRGE